jgi:hypothetical protein
LVGEKTFPEK